MPRTPQLTELEDLELKRFREKVEAADLPDVLTVAASIIDAQVDILRGLGAPEKEVSMAAAVAIELRVRQRHLERPSRLLGNC